jgi:signal transduction histidine kinase
VIISETQTPTAARSKLLFIDDDPTVLASLNLLLGKQYETFSSSTVKEGLRLFEEVHPEIVLLDLRLPDRSGIEALREIRRMDPTAPVVILTAYSTRIAAEESLRLGATDYINKPFVASELTRKIERLLLSQLMRGKNRQVEQSIRNSVETFCDLKEFQNASAAFLHDAVSPLSSLMVGVDLLNQKIKDNKDLMDVDVAALVRMMSTSVSYLRALVEQWRSFSDIHTLMHGKCEARSAVDLAVGQVVDQIHALNILLVVQHPKEKLLVSGNDFALARVLVNLLKNATEAVAPLNGRINVTAARLGGTYQLVVSDNGSGISAEDLDKIFLPRFTTKSKGKGLGLFISKKIVEAMGGKISVQSPGAMAGTDFTIILPLVS